MIRKESTLKHLATAKDEATWQIDIKRQHVRRRQTATERSRTRQPHHVVPTVSRTAVRRIEAEQLKVKVQTTRRNHLRRRQDAGTISCLHQTRTTDRADRARPAQLGARRNRYRPCGVESPVHNQLTRIHRRGTAEGALTIQRCRSGSLLGKATRALDHPIKLRIDRSTDRQTSASQLDCSPHPVHGRKLLTLSVQIQNGSSRLNHRAR